MCINVTSFRAIQIRRKVLIGMRKAIYQKETQVIYNRKGVASFTIKRVEGNKGRIFQFIDSKGRDITESAYRGLAAQ